MMNMLMIICIFMLNSVNAFMSPLMVQKPSIEPFNNWHCIDFVNNIDKKKPYSYNIGKLPLVTWFDKDKPMTTVNICTHMGSKLDEGTIKNGCLKCPYHGLEYSDDKTFGETMVFQDKLWWSYEPTKKCPPAIPFYKNRKYETSYIKIDVNANIIDCAFNTMDINHPAYIHNNIFGFGSSTPPSNIKTISYPNNDKIGISFNYESKSTLVHLKREIRRSKNFHIYEYPYTSWSRVTLPNKEELFVNVNMLPLENDKTRWLVTLKHNFWKSSIEKRFMKFAADCILYQDQQQMNRQTPESVLKKIVSNQTILKDEEHLEDMRKIFKNYKFPNTYQTFQLYKYHKEK